MKKFICLTIAGSDCSGGAGIQADLKTFTANNTYGCSVITALTAQNTQGVKQIKLIEPDFILAQAESVFSDLDVDVVKIGMLGDIKLINVVHQILTTYQPKFVVVDPVMVAKGGAKLLVDRAIDALINKIIPYADLITPNLHESAAMLKFELAITKQEMANQAKLLKQYGCKNVLLKGGHFTDTEFAVDCLVDKQEQLNWFELTRIDSIHTHGTGCTLSAAICAIYPQTNYNLFETIRQAKQYVHNAIIAGKALKIGKGIGPLDHNFGLNNK